MKKLNIAYCIMCHKNTEILKVLVEYIQRNGDVYIHVDKKSKIEEFRDFDKEVVFLENRVEVLWGHFSQIQAMINLLEETKNKKYDYVFMLSGDDLPIKSNEYVNKFLNDNYGYEFLGYEESDDIDKRVKYKYNKYWYGKRNNLSNKIVKKLQMKYKIFSKNKLYESLPKLYKGPNWFTVTGGCVDYTLEYLKKNKNYLEAFKDSWCADEVFFHTIILNSKLKENIYRKNTDDNKNSLRYIDWRSGPEYPKVLHQEDYDKIKESKDTLFARKFSEDIDLEDYINKFKL